MQYGLGVDLGTTQTAAAVRVDGRVEVVRLGGRRAEIPSLVFVKPDGNLLIGEAAERRGQTEPARLAREFKRRMGDPVPILVGGTPFSAHALTAKLLRHVLDTVTQAHSTPPTAITVTHPANWGPYKREQLDQAIRLADATGVRTRTEPEAAALQHATARRITPGETVAVYDLGGGTFDVAVLRRDTDGFTLLGEPEGIEQLGGIDFDEAVFGYVLGVLGNKVDTIDPNDPESTAALARLRRDCIEAKEALSFDTETMIPVALPGLHTRVRLNRSELEAMIAPSLTDTITATSRALRGAGVPADQLSAILLAGGSSRIPLITELLSTAFQRPVITDPHPEHSIAMGAAVATTTALDGTSPLTTAIPPPRPSSEHSTVSSPQRGATAGAAAAAGLSTAAPGVSGNAPVSGTPVGGSAMAPPFGGNAPASGAPVAGPTAAPPFGGNAPASGAPATGPSVAAPFGGNAPASGAPATGPTVAAPFGGNVPVSGAPATGPTPFGGNAPATPVAPGRGPVSFSRGAAPIPGATPTPGGTSVLPTPPGGAGTVDNGGKMSYPAALLGPTQDGVGAVSGAPGLPSAPPGGTPGGAPGVPGNGAPGVPGKGGTQIPWPPPPLPPSPGGEKRNIAKVVAYAALAVALLAGGTTAALLVMNSQKDENTGAGPTPPTTATTVPTSATTQNVPPPLPTDTMLVRVDTGGTTAETRQSKIYTFTPGTDARTLLPNTKIGDAVPKWSHDRNQIALTGRDGDSSAIFVMNADGSNRRKLVSGGGRAAWSADDQKIAFIRKVDDVNQIFVVTIATGAVKQLTHSPIAKDDAMWSPDGKTILYWLDKGGVKQIYELTVADPQEPGRQITRPQVGPANDPVYSPNGKKVLFTREVPKGADIWVVDIDGSNAHRITSDPAPEMDPTWSPDGTWFAFARFDSNNQPSIVAERLDGSGETTLTQPGQREGHPCWF